MFFCSIELLHPVKQGEEPRYYRIGKHTFDPGFKEGDSFEVNRWNIFGKKYTFNVFVINRKYELYPPDRDLEKNFGALAIEEGVINLRIFVEAEDRDKMLEIQEVLDKNN